RRRRAMRLSWISDARNIVATCDAWYAARTRRFATQIRRNPPNCADHASTYREWLAGVFAIALSGPMIDVSKQKSSRRPVPGRRIVVLAVPPVDELDLVGPMQVFNSVNRLAGRNVYSIEVVSNADSETVAGEGGILTFVARHHFRKLSGQCDSILLVCGLK